MAELELWEVRHLHGGLSLELRGGEKPALVIVQGGERVRVELADVKTVIAGMGDAAADLAGVLAAGGVASASQVTGKKLYHVLVAYAGKSVAENVIGDRTDKEWTCLGCLWTR